MALDACTFTSGSFFYKHEWAASLIPPEYVPYNVAGNVGEQQFLMEDCAAAEVGNQTFVSHVKILFFAIQVHPPAGTDSGSANYYLLDLVASNTTVVQQLREGGIDAKLGTFRQAGPYLEVDAGPSGALNFTAWHSQDSPENDTYGQRFHWKAGERHCWMDELRVLVKAATTEATLVGQTGPPAIATGPAHSVVGVGSAGSDQDTISPPACEGT
jgi:hypothetical protein